MSASETDAPNAEQIEYWNEKAGPTWVAMQDVLDGQLARLGTLAMDRADLAAGAAVLDVGCGCGHTTLELGRRVGPRGRVLGIDISAPMLGQARRAAGAAGLAQVRFEQADAQTHRFEPAAFDVLFSRFGVMFFADPAVAFANLRAALRPGGRLAFVCWQGIQDNPWMLVPMTAALQHLPPPPILDPGAPGPFAFADPARVEGILTTAGFGDVALDVLHETLTVGGTTSLDAAVDFVLRLGPTSRALQAADPALRAVVSTAVRDALAPYHTDGGVRMPSGAWLVTARNP
jgi:SAM-dependent methyltransferase